MTPTPWSPRQNLREHARKLGFFIFMTFWVAVVAFQGGLLVGLGWLALYLVLTAVVAAVIFFSSRRRYRDRWRPTDAKPPSHDAPVVIEGRLGSATRSLRSPFTGASCLGWGLVDDREGGEEFQLQISWAVHPFTFEDSRGRWRAVVRPEGPGGWHIPDVAEGLHLGGVSCSAEMKESIEKAVEALPESMRFGRVYRPLYGFELKEGDRVVVRGRWSLVEPGLDGADLATYELRDWSLEPGTAESIMSRHGYHWYAAASLAVGVSSLLTAVALGLMALVRFTWFGP